MPDQYLYDKKNNFIGKISNDPPTREESLLDKINWKELLNINWKEIFSSYWFVILISFFYKNIYKIFHPLEEGIIFWIVFSITIVIQIILNRNFKLHEKTKRFIDSYFNLLKRK